MTIYDEPEVFWADYELSHDQINKAMGKDFTCSICGRTVHEFGCNPEPFIEDANALCCDQCNLAFVIPIRVARMNHARNLKTAAIKERRC